MSKRNQWLEEHPIHPLSDWGPVSYRDGLDPWTSRPWTRTESWESWWKRARPMLPEDMQKTGDIFAELDGDCVVYSNERDLIMTPQGNKWTQARWTLAMLFVLDAYRAAHQLNRKTRPTLPPRCVTDFQISWDAHTVTISGRAHARPETQTGIMDTVRNDTRARLMALKINPMMADSLAQLIGSMAQDGSWPYLENHNT